MKTIGIIGVGDMGMGMAKNLLEAGFTVKAFDVNPVRLQNFAELGGIACSNCAEAAKDTDAVFIMVLNAVQANEVIFGDEGIVKTMAKGKTVILTATIGAKPATEINEKLCAMDINMIDSGVSGGAFGAAAGTLTMMASGKKEVFDENMDVLQSVGKDIYHVGEKPGMGQVVKACMQAVVGCEFAAVFEAMVLGAAAGIEGRVLADVIGSSIASSPLIKNCMQKILDRAFVGTGSAIGTYYKDVCITNNMAKEYGVPMFTTTQVQQLFQAGITKFPDEDNWSVVKILEEIVGVEVK